MKEFNENPFMATTPVCVFSNGTDADDWFTANCNKCTKQNKCGLEKSLFDTILDSSSRYCIIPLHIAKRIGIEYDALYQQGQLYKNCKELRIGNEPF